MILWFRGLMPRSSSNARAISISISTWGGDVGERVKKWSGKSNEIYEDIVGTCWNHTSIIQSYLKFDVTLSTTLRKLFLILLLGCWGSRISSEYFKSSQWYGWGWVKGQLDGFHECLDSGNSHGKTFVFLPFWRTLQRLMVRLGFLCLKFQFGVFAWKLLMLFIYSCSMKIVRSSLWG